MSFTISETGQSLGSLCDSEGGVDVINYTFVLKHTHAHVRTHMSPGPAFSPSSGEELSDRQKHPGSLSLSGSTQSPRRAAPTPPSTSASVLALTKEPAWRAIVCGVAKESDRT